MKNKKLLFIFVACVLCFLCMIVGCNNQTNDNPENYQPPQLDPIPTPEPNPTPEQPTDNGILVVYFSYTGITGRVANAIANQLQTKAIEIVPTVAYTAEDTNYNNPNSRNRRELANDLRPDISEITFGVINMNDYKTVIIGYPIWNGYEPMIIRTFIEHYNGLQGKTVYTFSTSASSSGNIAFNSIKNRYASADVKENLHFTSSAIGSMQSGINEWLIKNGFTEENNMNNNVLYLKIADTTLEATLVDNSSTRALKELLTNNGPITIHMNDYANFEKVGDIGTSLPRNDEYIVTEPCDLILYLGRSFVIYYDTNRYTLTRLGKINGVTKAELMQILGRGSVTVILSLTK